MSNKKRIEIVLKYFMLFLVIGCIVQCYKGADNNYYTAISIAFGIAMGISFNDKFKSISKKEVTIVYRKEIVNFKRKKLRLKGMY